MDLGRRVLGRTPATESALQKAHQSNDGAVDLAGELFQAAIQDPQLLAAVRAWMTTSAEHNDGTVVNFNNGGTVGFQAGTITGGTVHVNTGAWPRG